MSSNNLKNELADHIYHYLCHEAQYSDLPEAARESLTAASECIEQAYKLNVNGNTSNNKQDCNSKSTNTTSSLISGILPDELLRIFTRHKEFLSQQQKDSINYSQLLRNESESSSTEKPDIRVNSHPSTITNTNDPQHNCNPTSNAGNTNINPLNISSSGVQASLYGLQQQQQNNNQQQPQSQQAAASSTTTTANAKQHSQHPISQLPMTTRKKLSHLRAQIKRQASKAARSRLEKRSSVSGVASSSGGSFSGGVSGHLSGLMGSSLDANNVTPSHSKSQQQQQQAGDGYGNMKESGHHQTNSSSTESSTNAYLNSPSTSSPGGAGGGGGGGQTGGQMDSSTSSNLSPTITGQQIEGGASGSNKQSSHHQLIPGNHHNSSSIGVSVHQKNFKQKLIALIKKFRTDGSDFDSEEQYREALERELMKAAAGRGSRAIEELLEEDIDVEGESGSEPEDWDNISETSTPKPSLRPFFSSTTLDKI